MSCKLSILTCEVLNFFACRFCKVERRCQIYCGILRLKVIVVMLQMLHGITKGQKVIMSSE
jgi:hypothetical protein